MTDITVYVKSRAFGKEGFYWQNATNGKQETPEFLEQPIIPKKTGDYAAVNFLIIEDKPSLILMRHSDRLCLQVTGFQSTESDFQGREFSTSIAWVVKDDEEGEAHIRYIAAKLLDDVWLSKKLELQEIVNQAVRFDGKEAFKVDLEKINQFAQGEVDQEEVRQEDYQIENQSSESIANLKEALERYKLPKPWKSWHETKGCDDKNKGVLVIVTNWLPDSGILHRAGVWRGFADNVTPPPLKKNPPTEKPIQELNNQHKLEQIPIKKKNTLKLTLLRIAVVFLLTTIVATGVLLIFWFTHQEELIEPIRIKIPIITPEIQTQPQQQQPNLPLPTVSPESQTSP
ncbi:MAG: hypothetical protein F6K54_32175 [Okeania sp. SIO3B5]|uniref:hypothetical protein n=1 Tax=Okeania sp. SIO3B5 TaxID=2607811 RepID=UPI001401A74D|nr:hypothetical protein [Okeania sp. SIO3B5]NEO57324.1 hypothetical protein [Okeania sp. SIO3B5]